MSRQAVDLDYVKRMLRVCHHEDDDLLEDLTTAATELVESRVKRDFITRKRAISLRRWPTRYSHPSIIGGLRIGLPALRYGVYIEMPIAPCQRIDRVMYYDTGNQLQTLPESKYIFYEQNGSGRISHKPHETWPTVKDRPDAITIEYTAGYGDTPADVPAAARVLITRLVRHWYDNQSHVVVGTISKEIELSFGALEASFGGYYDAVF